MIIKKIRLASCWIILTTFELIFWFQLAYADANRISSGPSLSIPPLPSARPFSRTNATTLVTQCHDISPTNRSPPMAKSGDYMRAEIEFAVDRFVGIDDVRETVSVTASLYVNWEVNTCSSKTTAPDYGTQDEDRILVVEGENVWRPAISFRNAVEDFSLNSASFSNRLEILFTPTTPYRQLDFYWKRRGQFEAVCNLDLAKFPFDTQECSFQFYMLEAMNLIRFSDAIFTPLLENNQCPVDSWRYIGYRLELNASSPDSDDMVSQAVFYLTFKRRPEYYINNLLAPCCVLAILELVGFAIPPQNSDRVCFSVYLLLAFAVGQSQVLNIIPKTPQNVMLNYFIQLLALGCGLCTVHAILMFWFVSSAPRRASKKVVCNLSLYGLIELIAFLVFVAIFAGICYFCLSMGGIF